MNKKIFTALVSFCACVVFCFSEDASLKSANRKTAVRCLKIASSYLTVKDYENALSQGTLGLAYDDSVADLWYITAAAKSGLMYPNSEVLALVTKALNAGDWVDYNRDGARILYADILCDTGKYDEAVSALDSAPLIYSSDAEFIRAKAYYRMHTPDSIQKARDKINSARKIFSSDTRFPRLFFKNEYALRRDKKSDSYNSGTVKKIADFFIARMPEYDNPDAELEIYAALFADGERQVRMLNAFASHGMSHPLYAVAALKAGIISQQEAWDYFCGFADKQIPIEFLADILPMITKKRTIESVKEHLDAYAGILTQDTDGDCEPNLIVNYTRGRPASFSWDKDNDGILEWSAECDFGSPVRAEITQGNISAIYGTFPYAVQIIFKPDTKPSGFAVKFNLLDETFKCAPFKVSPYTLVKKLFKFDFFIPEILDDFNLIDESVLFSACASYEVPSDERGGAEIHFYVLDGTIQTAEYEADGKIYARTMFENGFPIMRSVDNDGDGIFETTETFGYDSTNTLGMSKEESSTLMKNLFGRPSAESGIYIKMIQIDRNADTVPDFTEEYLAFGGKISSWDNDGDGKWNVQYKRYPRENADSPLIEDSLFYAGTDKTPVTVTAWDGQPVKVQSGSQPMYIIHGKSSSFYWIGDEGTEDDEYFILEKLGENAVQGMTDIFQRGNDRMFAVKIGGNVYAQLLPAEK